MPLATNARIAQASGNPAMAINGLVVSMLYWAQAAMPQAGTEFGAPRLVALMPAATLAGYALGVALQALFERDLTSRSALAKHLLLLSAGLALTAQAQSAALAAASCLLVGAGCSLTQRLLAMTASAVAPCERAGAIGRLVFCGLLGVVLARAAAPMLIESFGWRVLFGAGSAILCVAGLVTIAPGAPFRANVPNARVQPASVAVLWRRASTLRRAALLQAGIFAAFNAGWSLYPRYAAAHHLPFVGPACLVALLGAGAALAAGFACRRIGSANVAMSGGAALLLAGLAAPVAAFAGPAIHVAMALLDMGTQLGLVANHARVQTQDCSVQDRGRMAAMLTTVGFLGGALGTAVAALVS